MTEYTVIMFREGDHECFGGLEMYHVRADSPAEAARVALEEVGVYSGLEVEAVFAGRLENLYAAWQDRTGVIHPDPSFCQPRELSQE